MEDVVVDQPVDVIRQEARIQNRVDEVAAGVAVVDWVIFGIGVALRDCGRYGKPPKLSRCRNRPSTGW